MSRIPKWEQLNVGQAMDMAADIAASRINEVEINNWNHEWQQYSSGVLLVMKFEAEPYYGSDHKDPDKFLGFGDVSEVTYGYEIPDRGEQVTLRIGKDFLKKNDLLVEVVDEAKHFIMPFVEINYIGRVRTLNVA